MGREVGSQIVWGGRYVGSIGREVCIVGREVGSIGRDVGKERCR